MVLGDHDRHRQPLLGGRDQLGRGHQEGAVAEEGEHPAGRVGLGQADLDGRRQLVAHAGEAELQVAAAAAGGVPDFLEVAGGPPAAAMMVSPGWACSWSSPDDLPLGQLGVGVGDHVALDGGASNGVSGSSAPPGPAPRPRSGPGPSRPPPGLGAGDAVLESGLGEGGQGEAGVPDDRGGAEAGRVVAVHVDRGEPHLRVLEQRLEAVAKSVRREPTVRTRSAWRARALVAGVPSSPMRPSRPPVAPPEQRPRPKVSATGMPVARANAASSREASE